MVHVCARESVDRLVAVGDSKHVAVPLSAEHVKKFDLHATGILRLIDENVAVEALVMVASPFVRAEQLIGPQQHLGVVKAAGLI